VTIGHDLYLIREVRHALAPSEIGIQSVVRR
jgi:hypothetical protein